MKKIFAILLCISLVFSLVGCGNTTDVSSNDSSSNGISSNNTSSDPIYSVPTALEHTLSIPTSIGYSVKNSFDNYFIDNNVLYFFENSTVKKVADLVGFDSYFTQQFVIRDNFIYYVADNEKRENEGKVIKQNLLNGEIAQVYNGYVFCLSINNDDIIYINGRVGDDINDLFIQALDINDNIQILEKGYIGYDAIGEILFMNNEMYTLFASNITLKGGIYSDHGSISLLDLIDISSDESDLYAVEFDTFDDYYVFHKCNVDTEETTEIAKVKYDSHEKSMTYAIGDNKIVYLAEDGDLYITDGTVTEKLVAGLPNDIKAWRIIDNIFCWYVSPENFGTVELYNAN